jgi:hypothetical protein
MNGKEERKKRKKNGKDAGARYIVKDMKGDSQARREWERATICEATARHRWLLRCRRCC